MDDNNQLEPFPYSVAAQHLQVLGNVLGFACELWVTRNFFWSLKAGPPTTPMLDRIIIAILAARGYIERRGSEPIDRTVVPYAVEVGEWRYDLKFVLGENAKGKVAILLCSADEPLLPSKELN